MKFFRLMHSCVAKAREAFLFATTIPCIVFSQSIVVPPAPTPEFADTEGSTNMPFSASEANAREVVLRFTLSDGAVSNCILVAFGRDANGDGILGVDEQETLFGWRNGRCIAENKKDGIRFEETTSATSRIFKVHMRLSKRRGLSRFSAADELGNPVFTNFSSSVPGWLHNSEWNMMRVTRRGPGVPAEWFSCDIRSRFFVINLR